MGVQGRRASGRQQQQQAIRHHQLTSDGFDPASLTSTAGSSSNAGDEQQTYESHEISARQHSRDCLHRTTSLAPHRQTSSQLASESDALPSIPSSGSQQISLHQQQQTPRAHHNDLSGTEPEQRAKPQMQIPLQHQQQQKHRQLQAHVHQQLQRIYGGRSHHPPRQQLHQKNQRFGSQDHLERQFSSHESGAISRPFNGAGAGCHQQSASLSSEQTYDSLSPPCFAPPAKQQAANCAPAKRIASARVHSAIPEEELLSDADHRAHQFDEQQEEDLLLLSSELNNQLYRPAQQMRTPLPKRQSQQEQILRESQLENLHYATVTAAALLSATANAAAAIAATATNSAGQQRKLGGQPQAAWPAASDQCKQPKSINQREEDQQDSMKMNEYSPQHPYQEVNSQRRQSTCCHHSREPQHQSITREMNCVQQQQQQQQQQQLQMQMQQMKQHRRRLQANASAAATGAAYQSLQPSESKEHRQSHLNQQQLRFRQQMPQMYQAKQQYHQALMNRPIPPQPPARGPTMVMMPPGGASRRSFMQQQHQPPPNPMSLYQQTQPQPCLQAQQPPLPLPAALAVLHTGPPSKAASAKADLIGRMLINNMVAAQQRLVAESRLYKGAYGRALAGHRQPENAESVYHRARPELPTTICSSQHLQPAVARAPSDHSSGGHSSAPLVVNRDLAPMSFIERLCRIDLTLFWWSLLAISLLFVGIVVTISRYVL